MPKLWNETIEAHRRSVVEATLDTTAALVAEHGLRGVTMSAIAERTGIGRATLYKYFPDVEAILLAWHERQIATHLHVLSEVRDRPGDPSERLRAVLEAYANFHQRRIEHGHGRGHGHPGAEPAAMLHSGGHMVPARHKLHELIRDLLAEAAQSGDVRTDVTPDELATYTVHALDAATLLPSKAAIRRLVTVTLSGLRPPGEVCR